MIRIIRWLPLVFPVVLSSYASNEQGTGEPIINMVVTSSSTIVVSIESGDFQLIGSEALVSGYSDLALTARDQASGALLPEWGRVEVLLGCYQADVLLYQQTDGGSQEVLATTVATDYCIAP
ncbi:MAG: hypothetical protein Tsb002_13810 [Wenzhouxiangellaceae bacterium]